MTLGRETETLAKEPGAAGRSEAAGRPGDQPDAAGRPGDHPVAAELPGDHPVAATGRAIVVMPGGAPLSSCRETAPARPGIPPPPASELA